MSSTFTPPPLKIKKQLSPAQLAARQKGGKARASQFTPEHQSKASQAQKEKYGSWMLSEWGTLGYNKAMRLAGFTDTNYMRHAESREAWIRNRIVQEMQRRASQNMPGLVGAEAEPPF